MSVTKYIVEFIGTFIFLSVILNTGAAIPIGIALTAVIFFGSNVSGAHFNPAVSLMMYLKGKLDAVNLTVYVSAQLLGGVAAYYFNKIKG